DPAAGDPIRLAITDRDRHILRTRDLRGRRPSRRPEIVRRVPAFDEPEDAAPVIAQADVRAVTAATGAHRQLERGDESDPTAETQDQLLELKVSGVHDVLLWVSSGFPSERPPEDQE